MARKFFAAFAFLALFAFSVGAQDDLKDFAAKQRIAAQKLKVEVRDALDNARRLQKTDATEARFILERMIRRVQAASDLLTESDRTPLIRSLQAQLAQVHAATRAKRIIDDQRPPYRDPGRPRTTRPAADPNDGPISVAKRYIGPGKAAQQTYADLIRQRERNLNAIKLSIEKDPPIPTGDVPIAFPSYWKELTKRAKDRVSAKLTDKEKKVLKTLNSTISVEYEGDKFKTVIGALQDRTGLSIIIDEGSLKDANADYDDPVNFKVQKVSVRTVLKKILGDKGLTYIIKEGAIQVMTPKKASEFLVTRTYQIDDLIAPDPQVQMMFGPFVAQFQMAQNAQQLINLIQMTIEPQYWQPNGPGSITFFFPTRSLVIRASTEMHYQLGSPGLFGNR
ncbi:MAG: hypothetical protein HYX68_06180 [Planctomycetes bacterium]|nr:hypothetical protein [Planctomycetota bacterium]